MFLTGSLNTPNNVNWESGKVINGIVTVPSNNLKRKAQIKHVNAPEVRKKTH